MKYEKVERNTEECLSKMQNDHDEKKQQQNNGFNFHDFP